MFNWLDDVGLLVAEMPWEPLLGALRRTSGETFEVRSFVADWGKWWMEEAPRDYRTFPLLAGELNGRSYVVDYSLILPSTADRISALAADSGGLVLGMGYQDTTGTATVTAARGATLLRYAFDCAAGRHEEGAALPGEAPNAPAWTPKGFRKVLAALGFDVDGWLERGAKWDVLWTMLDAGEQPEAHERLYFGPLRQRIDELQNAALDGF